MAEFDTRLQRALSDYLTFATRRSNHLILSENVAETGRPAIGMETKGDIILRAAGRIHRQSAYHSAHVDGKELHTVQIKLFNKEGSTQPYQNEVLHASLSDGSAPTPVIASGQHFPGIPQGNCKFAFKTFYDDIANWKPDDVQA